MIFNKILYKCQQSIIPVKFETQNNINKKQNIRKENIAPNKVTILQLDLKILFYTRKGAKMGEMGMEGRRQ